MDILMGVIEQGLTYSFLAFGLYIAYSILDFPDLTVDGSFPLGAAISVFAILKGINPALALLISFFGGAIAGSLTGLIHIKLKVEDLLAGLIMQTALWTINLKIAGKANVPIFSSDTIFTTGMANFIPNELSKFTVLFVMIPTVIIIKILLDEFLKTKAGFILKACGDNEILVRTMAVDPGTVKILGLSFSNGLVALSGGLVAQEQRFFEVSMGTGSMVMGLAAVVLGIKLLESFNFIKDSTKVLIGSILYKASIALAIAIGFSANSMKLITAIIFLVILIAGRSRKKVKNA
ncbi:ABC transporter permease [Peptoniphilus sp. AGMB00490]|uniref:ABC transporter permease n=1 Tax=Peptoniphilus faecalis TaxID=2731255 RepID=A0A848RFQ2_9FIRM|nr:ABC transporter permease [Peptoniphilus faecalis]NMW84521.1 ABC transporter permease [Peptoniphilus faecalis]